MDFPRPSKTDDAVHKAWVDFILEAYPEFNRDVLMSSKDYLQMNAKTDSFLALFYFHSGLGLLFPLKGNSNISQFCIFIEDAFDAAYDKVVREWVLKTGIRVHAKEGDAVEIRDPESKMEKIGTVMAVFKPQASCLVQYRDKDGRMAMKVFGTEDILKVYKDGKPWDNNPRGGKVGFSTATFVEAKTA